MSNYTIEELYLRRDQLIDSIKTGDSPYLDDPQCGKAEHELQIVKRLIESKLNEA